MEIDRQVSNGQVFLTFGVRSRYGYPQKVGWQFMQSADGPVTLHGWNLRTHQPIWFGHPLPGAASAVIAWPGGILRDHQGPDLIFVPAAGCYQLQAQWKGGSWNLFFSAGCSADRRLFGVAHCR